MSSQSDRGAAARFVPLEKVEVGSRRQRTVSAATVERYRQLLEAGRQPPPVRLVRHGERYLVRDGRHRVAAARAAGHADIEAVVS